MKCPLGRYTQVGFIPIRHSKVYEPKIRKTVSGGLVKEGKLKSPTVKSKHTPSGSASELKLRSEIIAYANELERLYLSGKDNLDIVSVVAKLRQIACIHK